MSLAYLSVVAHRRNREQQGASLRSQALELQTLVDPIPEPLPPTRSERAAAERAASVESLKDKWNDEVSKAIHWVQRTDWDEVREGVETQASGLWSKLTGETPASSAERAKDTVERQASDKARGIREAARGAFDSARSAGRTAEEAAEHKALEARLKTKRVASEIGEEVKEKADEARSSWSSWLGFGKEKAGELVGKAKSAVGFAESQAKTLDGLTFTTGMSPVERALHQRYEKVTPKDTRTVEQVLKERYVPIDKRDNSLLRGL